MQSSQVDVQISASIESWVDITATVRRNCQRVTNSSGDKEETSSSACPLVAVTAASVAALTVYDMCKASSKDIIIHNLEVHGGRDYF